MSRDQWYYTLLGLAVGTITYQIIARITGSTGAAAWWMIAAITLLWATIEIAVKLRHRKRKLGRRQPGGEPDDDTPPLRSVPDR